MMTYQACYEEGVSRLAEAGVPEAALDARLLLEHICGTDRNALLVHGDREVDTDRYEKYVKSIQKRAQRIPLQHITGEQEFMGLSFLVNENVLIPRQDTEILTEMVWKALKPGMSILDMCTGSGCILISLLHLVPGCRGTGADISEKALETAAENARRLLPAACGADRPERGYEPAGGGNIQWLQSNLFQEVEGTYDIIVSNPPYIATEVIKELMPEVREHEPVSALDGAEDGLYFYRQIAGQAAAYLKPEGKLFLEIGYDQAEAVTGLLKENGFQQIEAVKDYAGLDRVVWGSRA